MSREIKFRAWHEGKYEIGSDGSIWSTRFNNSSQRKQLRTYPDRDGYRRVFFTINAKRRIHSVHGLVAWAFHGERPSSKHHVNHKNGVRPDNRATNLEYVTPAENALHAWRSNGRQPSEASREHGRRTFSGSRNPKAKLTPERVAGIRFMRDSGSLLKDIAAHYQISIAQAGAICQNRFWRKA